MTKFCKKHPEIELQQKPNSTLYFPCPKCESDKRMENNSSLLGQSSFYKQKEAKKGLKGEKTKTKKKKPTIDKRLDDAWSLLVKLKAGMKCEVCGKTNALNSHHIYSRVKKSLRWNTINGICLCVGHHIGNGFSAHKTPNDFYEWLLKKKGKDFMDELILTKNMALNLHGFEKEILLKELQNQIKQFEK